MIILTIITIINLIVGKFGFKHKYENCFRVYIRISANKSISANLQ